MKRSRSILRVPALSRRWPVIWSPPPKLQNNIGQWSWAGLYRRMRAQKPVF